MLQCRHAQEFSFGPRALKDALISTNPALQELYCKAFSSSEKLFLSEAYNPGRTLFCSLFIRTAFDWLLSHPDAPEDFETFYYSLLRRKQRFCRKHIYLQPIDLSEGSVGISLLDSLRNCVESFFLGLQVKCLPSIPVSSLHCCYRHNQDSDRVQLHTDGILNFLKSNKPMDALCVLGLTLADLYPCETWSFTFGKFLPGQGLLSIFFQKGVGGWMCSSCPLSLDMLMSHLLGARWVNIGTMHETLSVISCPRSFRSWERSFFGPQLATPNPMAPWLSCSQASAEDLPLILTDPGSQLKDDSASHSSEDDKMSTWLAGEGSNCCLLKYVVKYPECPGNKTETLTRTTSENHNSLFWTDGS